MRPHPTPTLLLAACAFALVAACGGGSNGGGGPDRDAGGDDSRGGRADAVEDGSGDASDGGDIDDTGDGDGSGADVDAVDTADGSGDTDPDTADGGSDTDTDDRLCNPGVRACVDGQSYHRCNTAGDGWTDPVACDLDRYCADGLCLARECLPQVMFVVDGSSGMFDECNSSTGGVIWNPIRGPIATVIENNENVAYGLSMFPYVQSCLINPGTAAETWPHVAIQPEAAGAIDAWFTDHGPSCGPSPIVTTLTWFADNADAVWTEAGATRYLVLLTDGAEICRCDLDELECQVTKLSDATEALLEAGVRTYVIGYRYGDDPVVLNTIATTGGTGLTEFVSAEDATTLTDAFQVIIDDAKLCAD